MLTPFDRGTQLQGHQIGMGLTGIPDYLAAAAIRPDLKKAGHAARDSVSWWPRVEWLSGPILTHHISENILPARFLTGF